MISAVNIFVILLMALFMAGYYFMDAPHVSIAGESRAAAMETAELKSVLSCVLRAHSDAVLSDGAAAADQKSAFDAAIPCAEKYEIKTRKICADDKRVAASCAPDKADKIIQNYIVTTTDVITENGAGKVLEILAHDYPNSANLGIISIEDKVPHILSSGGVKREISRVIAKDADFRDGQLAYITQYARSMRKNPIAPTAADKIKCGKGEMPVFRQNAWTCVSSNMQRICSGDFIWDAGTASCVPDSSKRPLCRSNLAAVMIDGVWECVAAAEKRDCPAGTAAMMNYEALEWECVPDSDGIDAAAEKKCGKAYDRIYGGGTTALRGSLVSCNDCERTVMHDDCTAECVPDAAAVFKKSCYAGNCADFYFGFPDAKYIAAAKRNIPELAAAAIPIDAARSRNRKFNCMECPFGTDALASMPPYVIICNQ